MAQTRVTSKPPLSFYVLISSILFQGLSGLAGGIGLVADPTGRSLGIPLDWLQGSPFDSYLIPGLVLLLALGVYPLAVAYAMWKRRPWSRLAALLVGLMLLIWIAVEILVVGYQPSPPLQLIYGLLGLIIVAMVPIPSLKQYIDEHAA